MYAHIYASARYVSWSECNDANNGGIPHYQGDIHKNVLPLSESPITPKQAHIRAKPTGH